MAGTVSGGKRAAKTNKAIHGKDFYVRIGRKGGHNSTHGGFASDKVGKDGLTGPERARLAGAKGGTRSSRAGVKNGEGKIHQKEVEPKKKAGFLKRLFGSK